MSKADPMSEVATSEVATGRGLDQARPASPSIGEPEYWWYRARAELLQVALSGFVGEPEWVLDVGSADGPSVRWLRGHGARVALDIDLRGLEPGDVCGSAMQLPFPSETFDVVAAFDVIEHCEPEAVALAEAWRVLRPGGRLLMSVPAYQWAWTDFDEQNHHHRRYTRRRAVASVEAQGFEILRASYLFAGTFPFFAADRMRSRMRERRNGGGSRPDADIPGLPQVSRGVERMLLGATRIDRALLRRADLPFGSSVVVAARKVARPNP